ncbi:hypothetical protein B0A49_01141 [Cryomyces minteri]|uniref:Uncharacterized protein n=1 Tax=Cryomyces minteri TaxID=331657 RepID=A0A4U0XSV4_9PEZI|nr:hypothetical protein B0A49_01141 [Cryomyces minteri]
MSISEDMYQGHSQPLCAPNLSTSVPRKPLDTKQIIIHESSPAADSRAEEPPSREWRSWKTKAPFLSFLLLSEICMIGAILGLDVFSNRHSGFTTVQLPSISQNTSSISNFIWSRGLLWTSLPSFLMTLYRLMWESAVSGSVDRQPFVELKREKGASPRLSILLDYRAYPSLYTWAIAFRNGHFLLGFCILLSLLLSIAVVPLSAHLCATAVVLANTTVPAKLTTSFNDSAFTSRTDLLPVFGLASASSLYGGNPPAWASKEFAFQAFSIEATQPPNINVTVGETAYSAYLDCSVLTASDYTASFTRQTADGGTLAVKATDRGCSVANSLAVSNLTSTYVQTWSTIDCAAKAGYSRPGVLAGLYAADSPDLLSNFTIISCIPSYWMTSGLLSANMGSAQAPSVISFAYNDSDVHSTRPDAMWRIFENGLHEAITIDSTSKFSTTEFGRLIYIAATQSDSDSPLSPRVLSDATARIFNSIYATLAATVLFQPAASPTGVQGIYSANTTRLVIVSSVAYTIAAALFAILLCTVGITVYAHTHPSVLFEEPVGLLSYAGMLDQSDVSELAAGVRNRSDYSGGLTKTVVEENELGNTRCRALGNSARTQRIVVEGLRAR